MPKWLIAIVVLAVVAMLTCTEPVWPPVSAKPPVGLNVQVAPAGSPEHAVIMVPLNVEFVAKFNVTLPDCPAVMLRVCGVAVSENDGARGCTTTLSIAEVVASWLESPLYAAVMMLVPAGSPDAAN
jgi:hypothetical protein